MVNDPLQRRTIAEAVFVGFGRNAFQSEKVVIGERGLVLAEAHLLDAPVQLAFLDTFQRIFGLLFVVDVQVGEATGRLDEGPEYEFVVGVERAVMIKSEL